MQMHVSIIDEYPMPRIKLCPVSGAQIGGQKTLEDGSTVTLDEETVYELLRQAAQDELDAGYDQPSVKVQVEFIELGRTVEYSALAELQTVNLYDWVTVIHGPRHLRLRSQVYEYEYDCLQERYTMLNLGDVFANRTAGVI